MAITLTHLFKQNFILIGQGVLVFFWGGGSNFQYLLMSPKSSSFLSLCNTEFNKYMRYVYSHTKSHISFNPQMPYPFSHFYELSQYNMNKFQPKLLLMGQFRTFLLDLTSDKIIIVDCKDDVEIDSTFHIVNC